MKREYAQYLMQKTRKDYDAIAGDFDRTRAYCWEGLEQFAKYADDGDRILDFGCGNGRLFSLFRQKNISYIGVDQSGGLIDRAREKFAGDEHAGKAEFVRLEGRGLPFLDASFDCAFAIASLHHIPSVLERERVLAEFRRVLKPGGRAVITAWNLWQKKYRGLIVKYTVKKLIGGSPLDFFDIFVPWKTGERETVAERYYHCFTMRELKKLMEREGFRIEEAGYFGGKTGRFNMYVVAVKE